MYHLPKCVWLFTWLGAPNLFVPGDAYSWAQASVCYLILQCKDAFLAYRAGFWPYFLHRMLSFCSSLISHPLKIACGDNVQRGKVLVTDNWVVNVSHQLTKSCSQLLQQLQGFGDWLYFCWVWLKTEMLPQSIAESISHHGVNASLWKEMLAAEHTACQEIPTLHCQVEMHDP